MAKFDLPDPVSAAPPLPPREPEALPVSAQFPLPNPRPQPPAVPLGTYYDRSQHPVDHDIVDPTSDLGRAAKAESKVEGAWDDYRRDSLAWNARDAVMRQRERAYLAETRQKAERDRINLERRKIAEQQGLETFSQDGDIHYVTDPKTGKPRYKVGASGYRTISEGRDDQGWFEMRHDQRGPEFAERIDLTEYVADPERPGHIVRRKQGEKDATKWEAAGTFRDFLRDPDRNRRLAAEQARDKAHYEIKKAAEDSLKGNAARAKLALSDAEQAAATRQERLAQIDTLLASDSPLAQRAKESIIDKVTGIFGETPDDMAAAQREIGQLQQERERLLAESDADYSAIEQAKQEASAASEAATLFGQLADAEGIEGALEIARERDNLKLAAQAGAEAMQRLGLADMPADQREATREEMERIAAGPDAGAAALAREHMAIEDAAAAMSPDASEADRQALQARADAWKSQAQEFDAKAQQQQEAEKAAKRQRFLDSVPKIVAASRLGRLDSNAITAPTLRDDLPIGVQQLADFGASMIGAFAPGKREAKEAIEKIAKERRMTIKQATDAYRQQLRTDAVRDGIFKTVEEADNWISNSDARHGGIFISPITGQPEVGTAAFESPEARASLLANIENGDYKRMGVPPEAAQGIREAFDRYDAAAREATIQMALKTPDYRSFRKKFDGKGMTEDEIFAEYEKDFGWTDKLLAEMTGIGAGAVQMVTSTLAGVKMKAGDLLGGISEDEAAKIIETLVGNGIPPSGDVRSKGMIGQTIGQYGPQLVLGALMSYMVGATRGKGKLATAAASALSVGAQGLMFGMQIAADAYVDVFQQSAIRDPETGDVLNFDETHKLAMQAFDRNIALGFTEIVPVGKIFSKIPPKKLPLLLRAIAAGGTESAQEVFQQEMTGAINNAVAGTKQQRMGLDEVRDIFLGSALVAGGGLGIRATAQNREVSRAKARYAQQEAQIAATAALADSYKGSGSMGEMTAPMVQRLTKQGADQIADAKARMESAEYREDRAEAAAQLNTAIDAYDALRGHIEADAKMAEAGAEVDAYAPQGVPQAQIDHVKHVARAVAKVAMDRADMMTAAEKHALETVYNRVTGNFDKVTIPRVEPDATGKPVIEESTRRWLTQNFPAMAKIFPKSESEVRRDNIEQQRQEEAAKAAEQAKPAEKKPAAKQDKATARERLIDILTGDAQTDQADAETIADAFLENHDLGYDMADRQQWIANTRAPFADWLRSQGGASTASGLVNSQAANASVAAKMRQAADQVKADAKKATQRAAAENAEKSNPKQTNATDATSQPSPEPGPEPQARARADVEAEPAPEPEAAQAQEATDKVAADATRQMVDRAVRSQKSRLDAMGVEIEVTEDALADDAPAQYEPQTNRVRVSIPGMAEFWSKRPANQAQRDVDAVIAEEAWHAIAVNAGIKDAEIASAYVEFAKANPDVAAAIGKAYSGWDQMTDRNRGHELLRMMLSFHAEGRTTEMAWADSRQLRKALRALTAQNIELRPTPKWRAILQKLIDFLTGAKFDGADQMRALARRALEFDAGLATSTREEIDAAGAEAATSPENNRPEPTEAQKEAGNYKKAKVKVFGMDVTIENPKGSTRTGKARGGKEWSVEMKHDYGYFNKTRGIDGDAIDVFIGPNPESQFVFVVDQVKPTKARHFDEHKVMVGFDSAKEAMKGYLANYSPGWKGLGAMTQMERNEFLNWVKNGDPTKPVAKSVKVSPREKMKQDVAAGAKKEKRQKAAQSKRKKPDPIKASAPPTDALFASRPLVEPGFYSALAEAVDQKLPARSTPDQAKAAVRKAPGVKPEELKWVGYDGIVDRLAAENGGKAPADALAAAVREQAGAMFQVVSTRASASESDYAILNDAGWEVQENPDDPGVFAFMDTQEGDIASAEEMRRWADDGDLEPEVADAAGRIASTGFDVKYAQYQLPGGENYREVVLAMPDKPRENFKSLHFTGVPNYVAHMRLNERPDADGEPGLFIEEIQSDRHQKGRKEGYVGDEDRTKPPPGSTVQKRGDRFRVDDSRGHSYAAGATESEAIQKAWEALQGNDLQVMRVRGVADAPYRKDWPLAMFKRALRDAVESGKAWVGWTVGETQNDRYDLSKQVGEIRHWESDEAGYYGVQVIEPNGQTIMHEDEMISVEQLENLVGKDVTQRIIDGEGEDIGNNAKSLSGDGLKVGGKGMRGFYDGMLPKEVAKYVKQWGGKVVRGSVPTEILHFISDSEAWFRNRNDAIGYAKLANAQIEDRQQYSPIWRVEITPEMRAGVSGGQALFASKPAQSSMAVRATMDLAKFNPEGLFGTTLGEAEKAMVRIVTSDWRITEPHVVRVVPLAALTPIQFGDDYINPSSRETARLIREGKAIDRRWQDVMPILANADGTIKDGHHRHAAAAMNGDDSIAAVVPVNSDLANYPSLFANKPQAFASQRQADAAAKKAGYRVTGVYHFTDAPDFETWDFAESPIAYFASGKNAEAYASEFGKRPIRAALKADKPLGLRGMGLREITPDQFKESMAAKGVTFSKRTAEALGRAFAPSQRYAPWLFVRRLSTDGDIVADIRRAGFDSIRQMEDNPRPRGNQIASVWGVFAPEQIKSAALDTGVPASERFDAASDSMLRASKPVTAEQDAEYMAAVERGDMDAAQKMVDAAAKAAGYETQAFHYSAATKPFDVFKSGRNSGGLIYFNETMIGASAAAMSHKNLYKVFLDMRNAYNSPASAEYWAEIQQKNKNNEVSEFDSFYVNDEGGVSIAVRDPNQIKSADPVTYDAEGNVIPLSQRFNPNSDSILYASKPGDPGILNRGATAAVRAVSDAAKGASDAAGITRVAKAFIGTGTGQALKGTAEKIASQLAPWWTLPREFTAMLTEQKAKQNFEKNKFLEMSRVLRGKGEAEMSGIHIPSELATQQNREAMGRVLDGKAPIASLPDALQTTVQKLRDEMDRQARRLLELGMMSPETYEVNRDRGYFPRYYLENERAETPWARMSRKLKMGLGWANPQLTSAFFVYRDAKPREAGAVDYGGRKIIIMKPPGQDTFRFGSEQQRDAYFEELVQQEVYDDMRAEGYTVTRDQMASPEMMTGEARGFYRKSMQDQRAKYQKGKPLNDEELEKLKLIYDVAYSVPKRLISMSHDIALAELFNRMAQRQEWFGTAADAANKTHRQIPDVAGFGAIRGKYLQNNIADQVQEMVDMPDMAMALYDEALRMWKAGKTIANPATHGRNVLGNIPFSILAGNNAMDPRNAKYYRAAVKLAIAGPGGLSRKMTQRLVGDAKIPKGVTREELFKIGLLGGDFDSAELRSMVESLDLPPEMPQGAEELPTNLVGRSRRARALAAKGGREAWRKIQTLYRLEDDFYKIAAYLKYRESGMSQEAAVTEIRKWFPFYDQIGNSGTLKFMRRFPFPFLSFLHETVRIMGAAAKEKPVTMAAMMMLPALLTQLSFRALGLNDEDEDEVMKDLRGKDRLFGAQPIASVVLPFADKNGMPMQWDLTATLPWGSMVAKRYEDIGADDNPLEDLAKVALQNPAASLVASIAQNKDTFSGRPIKETGMTGGEKAKAYFDFIARQLLPPITPGVGSADPLEIAFGADRKGRFLQERNKAQEAVRKLGGIDTRSAAPDPYRMAYEYAQKIGLPPQGDHFDTTPRSRSVRRLYAAMVAEDYKTMSAELAYLRDEHNLDIRTRADIEGVLRSKNPLYAIPRKSEWRPFLNQLPAISRKVVDGAVSEYEKLLRRAPTMLVRARSEMPPPKPKPRRFSAASLN